MQIQIVFFSDSHLGFDFPLKPRLQIRRRGAEFFENFNSVLDYAARQKVDLVVHGGDLFFRSKVPGLIIDLTYRSLTSFADSGIPVYIVPGNHERSQLPQALLLHHQEINIFSSPKSFIRVKDGVTISLSGFPCERNNIKSKFHQLLKESGWHELVSDIKILCLHQTIEGACVGPSNYIFKSGTDVIPLSGIPDDATVILAGHIHRRQELYKICRKKRTPVPVIFSGSGERTSFAEKNEIKGFYHLGFSLTRRGDWQITTKRFIPLPARPMIDIRLNSHLPLTEIRDSLLDQLGNQQDAVLRIGFDPPLSNLSAAGITAQWLRDTLPDTINFMIQRTFIHK